MTTYLYSLARRESDGERFFDLATGVDKRAFCARLRQDGVSYNTAERWAQDAAGSVPARNWDGSGVSVRQGDRFDYAEAGPGRESYRVLAIGIDAPKVGDEVSA